MRRLTIISGGQIGSEVSIGLTEGGRESIFKLPVGVETVVADELADAAAALYDCIMGYFVDDVAEVDLLPTTGIAEGSYCIVMDTQILRFLSGGEWV